VNCGAKTRLSTPCQKPALVGKKRCRLHGGKSLSGAAHPNFKHGKCTLEARAQNRETSALLKQLKLMAQALGMLA
jgi:glucans biosynthesis protein